MRFHHYEACPRCRDNGRDTRGDNLGVFIDGSYFCFACAYRRDGSVFRRFLQSTNQDGGRVNEREKSLLPTDFSRDIPKEAWQWLLQYGLPYTYWKDQVGYSAQDHRLVFRVGNPLQFAIGRYFGTEGRRKWYIWGDPKEHCEVVGTGAVVALVEDLISAHKIGQAAVGIPLFGTNVHPVHIYYLRSVDKRIVLWLDKDQNHSVRSKALRLSSLIGRAVDVVVTDNDPKALPVESIREYLQV